MGQWPLTAGEYVVSGSVSSPLRGAFHLSLTVLVRYRSLQVVSLGGWSPLLPTGLHVSRGTQDLRGRWLIFLYGTLTRCGAAFQQLPVDAPPACCGSYNPAEVLPPRAVWAAPISLATTLGISVDFFSSGY